MGKKREAKKPREVSVEPENQTRKDSRAERMVNAVRRSPQFRGVRDVLVRRGEEGERNQGIPFFKNVDLPKRAD